MLLVSTQFAALAASQCKVLGMPGLPRVVLPHPIGGTPLDSVLAKVDDAFEQIVAGLTTPLPAEEAADAADAAEAEAQPGLDIAGEDPFMQVQEEFVARGWGDGLPLVPPTETRVRQMIAGSGCPGGHVVGAVMPRMGLASIEKIAVNAVMAGCRPMHMPLLVTAVQAMIDPDFFLKSIQATTHPVSPLMIVSGPLAQSLGVHGGSGMYGPGPWSNGVLGRALRLILINIGGGRPVEVDRSSQGSPAKYSYCIAENEAASPWPPLRADHGFGDEVSTVMLYAGESPHNINDAESTSAGSLIAAIAQSMAQIGQNNVKGTSQLLLVLSPEHAATIAAGGYTKDDVRRAIYEEARIPLSRFPAIHVERRLARFAPKRYKDRPLSTMVTLTSCWEDVIVMVAGGPGKHSSYLPSFGAVRSQIRPVLKPDGEPWLAQDVQAQDTRFHPDKEQT